MFVIIFSQSQLETSVGHKKKHFFSTVCKQFLADLATEKKTNFHHSFQIFLSFVNIIVVEKIYTFYHMGVEGPSDINLNNI